MDINEFYRLLPVLAQDFAVSSKGWLLKRERFGKDFRLALTGFMERSNWPIEKIYEFRQKKLSEALERASKTPYYQRLFSEMGAEWRDFIETKNFSKLPVVKKSDIRKNLDDFRPRLQKSTDKFIQTSGTTGESFMFPVSSNVEPEQWALWWRYRAWHNIRRDEKYALFASAPVVVGQLRGRPYRFNSANNEYRFSIFHITKNTASVYVDSLNKIKPSWIHGNPTAIALLSHYIIELGLKLYFEIKCITVGSENLLSWQKQAIEKAFNARVFQHYGQAEAVANISECECGKLHTDEDYSYVEYLDGDEFDSFSMVGTQFNNYAFTFLRYETGDLATIESGSCCCGHPGRIVKTIDGRLTDYIILPNGEKVASLAAPFHSTDHLAGAQIYQGPEGDLTIKYIPGEGWSVDVLSKIEKSIRLRVGQEIKIKFMQVCEIEKTPRGKMKLLVSDYHR
ncbi:hypothetical protein KO465_08410 [Candidatus Micrarchaeota archaeon]|nr:hypothetical protein [Candidatus Micrarchaeota archaeon]